MDRDRPAAENPSANYPVQQPQAGSSSARTSAPHVTNQSTYTGPYALPVSRSADRLEEDRHSVPGFQQDEGHNSRGLGLGAPLPPLPPLATTRAPSDNGRAPLRTRTVDTQHSIRPRSGIDWIVPVEEKSQVLSRRTVGERLQPTITRAHLEREKYAVKAKMTGYALNAAIGIQVLLGSLTTGLAVVTTGKQTAISTTILGGLATITASYLARARGSNEPELSITRVKDLEQFIRECDAFQMDHGHITTTEYDDKLIGLRDNFEELLGNANGERKLSPPV